MKVHLKLDNMIYIYIAIWDVNQISSPVEDSLLLQLGRLSKESWRTQWKGGVGGAKQWPSWKTRYTKQLPPGGVLGSHLAHVVYTTSLLPLHTTGRISDVNLRLDLHMMPQKPTQVTTVLPLIFTQPKNWINSYTKTKRTGMTRNNKQTTKWNCAGHLGPRVCSQSVSKPSGRVSTAQVLSCSIWSFWLRASFTLDLPQEKCSAWDRMSCSL